MTMMKIALAKAQALPSTIDERRAKILKASLTTQKKSRDSSCCLSFSFCVFIAIILYSARAQASSAYSAGLEAAEPHIERPCHRLPLATENQTEHETDSESGQDPLRRVFADVLLAVILKTADAIERIIPDPFRAAPIFIGHCACGRTEIFRRFARMRHATICFFFRLRRNRRALVHLIFVSHRFPFHHLLDFRCRCFADAVDILSAGSFENLFRPIDVFAFIRVHRDQVIPSFQLLLIPLCLDLRNAETNQTADDTAGRCSYGRATKRRHNWTRGDKRTDAGNCQGPNSRQQSDHAAGGPTCSCTRSCALRRLCRFNVTYVTRAACIRHEH